MLERQGLPGDSTQLKSSISFQINQIKTYSQEIQSYQAALQSKDIELKSKDAELIANQRYIEQLEEALRLARRARFAATSEKLATGQCELFDEAELLGRIAEKEEVPVAEDETEGIAVLAHVRKRPKRQALPEHLPREDVIIDLPEDEKVCDQDGTPLKAIGEEVSEQLDYIPARMKVIRTIRKKYACPCCEETVKTAALPEKILPKSNAAPGLLAYIAVSKYVDALPLYRLEQMFKRLDVELPRNTMASWMIKLADKLRPIYNLMEEDMLASDYVCCDETKVQVLHEKGKKAQSQSYMWVRSRHGPGLNPIVLFDYDPSRDKEVPKRLLEGFAGYLQVDGYAGYDAICTRESVTRLGCMAHVRRKFFEVHKISKKSGGLANQVLKLIQALYKIEATIKDQSIEVRQAAREEESKAIFDKIKSLLDENKDKYPPTGLMGKAISYGRNQWSYLLNILKDGRLALDNNFTENRIRPFAVGRKNWLFSDSVAGVEASAMLYSILQTARGNGFEPYAYMRTLLTELPMAKTLEQIEMLLPHKIDPKRLS